MSSSAPLILVVDDELPIRRFLRTALIGEGYRVAEADTGQGAVRAAVGQPPDLVILDLGLPDLDGLEVLKQLRQWLGAPIIVLSARDREQQKVAALDGGADDYLTKPFGTGELLARIRVALRHAVQSASPEASVLDVGPLHLDMARRAVLVAGEEVHLTPIEYRLLTLLARNAGKVLTHRQLLTEVWGPSYAGETHYLRVFMAQLRRKVEPDPARPRIFLTEPGVGYRMRDS